MSNQGHGAGASQKQGDLVPGGYRYEFVVDPPDYVRCMICRLPSRDPFLTDCCGQLFCNPCLQEKIKSMPQGITGCPDTKCPNPRAFAMFRNKQVERAVKELRVFCTNKSKGCTWQDKITEINVHLVRNCPFEDVECTNQCGQMVQRQHFSKHVANECQCRTTKCKYCRAEGQYAFIQGQHKLTCPKYPVACPNNGCKISDLLQEGLVAHREKCPHEMIQCEYFDEGCTEKMTRQNLAKHNKDNMEKHLTLIKCELIKARKKEEEIQGLVTIKHDLGQKLDAIKQDLMIKLDIEMSNAKREIAAIRNDIAKNQSTSSSYRHW